MNLRNVSAWSIKQPVPSIVMFLLFCILGTYSFFNLGIDENPNIDIPTVTVSIAQPGAAPSELETQVTRRVEDAVAGIGRVKHISSVVNEGVSATSIEFELGTDTDRAVNDVRDSISRIRSQLPQSITEPVIQRLDFAGGPFVTYTVSSSARTVAELSWLIDNDISRALLAVSGVGQVQRSGGVDREVQVNLDPVQLEAIGVTADSVNTQIRALNINLPGGRGTVGGQEQSIRTLGSAETIQQLQAARVSLPNGGWAALSQLGTVTDTSAEPRQSALLDGAPVVAVQVVRSTGSNLVQVADGVDKALEELKKTLPSDIKITKIRTNAIFVKESYEATIESLLIGAALAVFVIWLALKDWRSAMISALAMPLSMIPTFFVIYGLGYTLNNMSLLGLALVIGILVDDAIVEIENIVRHIHMGKSPFRAALEAADEIGLAVVATTMSIIVVFIPVAFMGGIPGQFFKQFGVTVAVAVFFSLLVARLITPMMAAYFLKIPPKEDVSGRLVRNYERILIWSLAHRRTTVVAAALFFVFSMGLFSLIPTSLVSAVDRGEVMINAELPPGSSLATTEQTALEVTRLLKKYPEVKTVFASVGTPSTARPGMGSGGGASVNRATIYAMLTPRHDRKISQQALEDKIRQDLLVVPGSRLSIQAMGIGGKIQIMLAGPDSEELEVHAQKLASEMRTLSGLSDVLSSASLRSPQILVVPDTALAAEQGVSIASISRTAMIATVGDIQANLAKFDLPGRQIDIRVQLDPRYRNDLQTITNMRVASTRNTLIPLGSVAAVVIGSGPAQINRYDRDRQVTLSASLNQGYTLGQALKDIHALPTFRALPASIKEIRTGDAEIQRDIFSGFAAAIAAAILFIYAVLVLLFNDFLQPFTIMMSLPMSIGGAALGLMLAHQPLGLYALIGIVMLMGLVTKNAILLVEYCLMSMHTGTPRYEAIIAAGEARMRPILMTTVAMIAGMVPIAMGIGAGSEVRAPMAVAVIGGLITSTFLTLVLVPVVFTYVDDFKDKVFNRAKRRFTRSQMRERSERK
jgi:hydrophobic/amphiphilic exporter-1 (mainly G- bacteria), HAE1 family